MTLPTQHSILSTHQGDRTMFLAAMSAPVRRETNSANRKSAALTPSVQTCYSARHCRGRILSNRDEHNCKVKSRGKSWMDNNGTCHNL